VLSALSYRGFQSGLTTRLQAERLRGAVERGLANLASTAGSWELVWGPVAHRAPFGLVDDGLMYVVRRRDVAHEYAVVVRGTNPIAPLDWLFGDFWVGAQAPWGARPGLRDARISFSTLLGLNLLQMMQAPPPPTDVIGSLAHAVLTRISDAGDQVRAWLRPLSDAVASHVTEIRDRVLPLLLEVDDLKRASAAIDPGASLRALLDAWRSSSRRTALRALGDAITLVEDEQSFNALKFLASGEKLRESLTPGVTLAVFLQAAVVSADGAPVRVTVTGHSKGGALAPTLALWLADTQGDATGEGIVAWDPERRATVHCVAFAGPTAGNAAFAAHSDEVIGDRCHRIVNPLDVVPRAWETGTLATIPALYRDAVPNGLVTDLVGEIAAEGTKLGYTHVGTRITNLATHEDARHRDFFVQAAHQHIAGYLEAFGLSGDFADVLQFFNPLA
jgi:hypothetical protein